MRRQKFREFLERAEWTREDTIGLIVSIIASAVASALTTLYLLD